MHTIQVFVKDLRSALEVSNPTDAYVASLYDIGDLVLFSEMTVGVVLQLDKDAVTVIDQNNSVQTIKKSEIKSKMQTMRSIISDSQGNAVCFGDLIQVMGRHGEHVKRGSVVHVYRSFLFCKSNETNEHNGIFVAKGNNVNVVNAKTPQTNTQGNQVCFLKLIIHGLRIVWTKQRKYAPTGE